MNDIRDQSQISFADSLCFKYLNNSCPKTHMYSPIMRVLQYSLLAAIILLTVSGNMLVVITILHFKQLHTPTNYLILSLAIADLLVGVQIMPFLMVYIVESCWYTGQLHCKIHTGLAVMLSTASVVNLCLIAADRYFAVCHPLQYQIKINTSVTTYIVFLNWSFATIFGFSASFITNQYADRDKLSTVRTCEGACSLFSNRLATVLFPTLGIYFPGFIMVCIYVKIYFVAKKQAMLIQDQHRGAKKSNVASKTEIKATRTLAIIMGVFLTSWLPFYISSLLNLLPGYSPSISLLETFSWMATLNSTCNPIVYALFYSWFKRAFKIVFSDFFFNRNSSSLNLLND